MTAKKPSVSRIKRLVRTSRKVTVARLLSASTVDDILGRVSAMKNLRNIIVITFADDLIKIHSSLPTDYNTVLQLDLSKQHLINTILQDSTIEAEEDFEEEDSDGRT